MEMTKEGLDKAITGMVPILQADENVTQAIQGLDFSFGIEITDLDAKYYLGFRNGEVSGGVGEDPAGSAFTIGMTASVVDDMFSGAQDATALAMSGQMSFSGDMSAGMGLMAVMDSVQKAYLQARD